MGSSLLVPSWKDSNLFTFNGASISQSSLSLPITSSLGASSSAFASGGNCYITGWDKWIAEIDPSGSMTSYEVPDGIFMNGCSLLSGTLYVMQSDGTLGLLTSGGYGQTNIQTGNYCRSLQTDGSSLYTLVNTSGGPSVGILSLTTQTSGSFDLLSVPLQNTTGLALSGRNIGVIGYDSLQIDQSFTDVTPTIVSGTTTNWIGVSAPDNLISVMSFGNDGWSTVFTVSGNSDPQYVQFDPVGALVFVSNPDSGNLQIFGLVSSTLSLLQTLSLPSCGSVSFRPDGVQAIVAQEGISTISVLNTVSGTWSVGQTLTGVPASKVLFLSATLFAADVGNSVYFYKLVGQTWEFLTSISLDYVPQDITFDSYGYVYTCGTSGSFGLVSQLNLASDTLSLQAQQQWDGNALSFLEFNTQLSVLDGQNNQFRIFSLPPSPLSVQNIQSVGIANPNKIRMGQESVFTLASSGILEYRWGPPFSLVPRRHGKFSVYDGTEWTTVTIPNVYEPMACTVDSSGNFDVVTGQNTWVVFSSEGNVQSSSIIAPYDSKTASVPLGIGFLFWWNGNLYGTTPIGSALIQL